MSDDWEIGIISKGNNEFVNHKTEDTHLGSTSVVELNGTLGELVFFREGVPSEVNVSVTEVTNEFISSSLNITHEGAFQPADEGNDLDKSGSGDGIRSENSGNTVGVGVEGVTRVVNVSWKVDSGTGGDLAQEGQLADTSVLDLNVTKTVETFLAGTVQLSEGIPETKRGLGTKFVFEGGGLEGGLGGILGRSESSGGGEERGKSKELHLV